MPSLAQGVDQGGGVQVLYLLSTLSVLQNEHGFDFFRRGGLSIGKCDVYYVPPNGKKAS